MPMDRASECRNIQALEQPSTYATKQPNNQTTKPWLNRATKQPKYPSTQGPKQPNNQAPRIQAPQSKSLDIRNPQPSSASKQLLRQPKEQHCHVLHAYTALTHHLPV
jgi:hypothetical protein